MYYSEYQVDERRIHQRFENHLPARPRGTEEAYCHYALPHIIKYTVLHLQHPSYIYSKPAVRSVYLLLPFWACPACYMQSVLIMSNTHNSYECFITHECRLMRIYVLCFPRSPIRILVHNLLFLLTHSMESFRLPLK